MLLNGLNSPDEIEIYELLTQKGIEIVGGTDEDDTGDSLEVVEGLKEDEESLIFPFRKDRPGRPGPDAP